MDFAEANRRGLGLIQEWLPEGARAGREWVARNPTRHDGRAGSFKVNMDTGIWGDFATGDKGSDPVSLLAYLRGLSQGEAARLILGEHGGNGGQARKEKAARGEQMALSLKLSNIADHDIEQPALKITLRGPYGAFLKEWEQPPTGDKKRLAPGEVLPLKLFFEDVPEGGNTVDVKVFEH